MTLAKIPFGGLSGLRVELGDPFPWVAVAKLIAGAAYLGLEFWEATRGPVQEAMGPHKATEEDARKLAAKLKEELGLRHTSDEWRLAYARYMLGLTDTPPGTRPTVTAAPPEEKGVPNWVIPVAIIGAAFLLRGRRRE